MGFCTVRRGTAVRPNGARCFRVSKDGARFQVLYTFTGGSDGGGPNALVRTQDLALYGTTRSGDSHAGTIFRVGRNGALTTLFVFRRREDGGQPGNLVVGRDGALYGRTEYDGQFGYGTAFRFSPADGVLTVWHHFSFEDPLRGWPGGNSAFVAASDTNLYGLSNSCSVYSCAHGTSVFRMTPGGHVTPIWSTDHSLSPPLLHTPDGNLWASGDRMLASVSATTGAARLRHRAAQCCRDRRSRRRGQDLAKWRRAPVCDARRPVRPVL